jgi:hypothetical protein
MEALSSWFRRKERTNIYTFDHLRDLYETLKLNKIVSRENCSLVIETLRSISELVVYGDTHSESFFEFFCEKSMLSMFNDIMRQETKFPGMNRVKVQVIQTISILVQNVKTDTSLFYLMSNNHINDLLCMDLEFVAESDLLAHYVSFLKLISLMLTPATIQFFFNENAEDEGVDFPLYTEALRFFDHSENMVRIATRTLTLNVYRVHDEALRRFLSSNEHISHFGRVFRRLVRHWERIDRFLLLLEAEDESATKADLQEEVEEHRDFLYYVQDVMAIQITGFQDSILDMFRVRVLRPVIYNLISAGSQQEPKVVMKTTRRKKNIPTLLPPNVDVNVFRELPLSIQEEHINQYRESYRMEARKQAREHCRKLTPRELMLPVTCSQRKNQEIEKLHNQYKTLKRAYYEESNDDESKEVLKKRALEAKKKWKRLSISKLTSPLQLSPSHRT